MIGVYELIFGGSLEVNTNVLFVYPSLPSELQKYGIFQNLLGTVNTTAQSFLVEVSSS